MAKDRLEIVETDDAGNVIATYVQSSSKKADQSRVDIILPEVSKSIWQRTLDVFLPSGYPHSVTDDYMEYQIYDSLQAFSSSIASLLSSRAVLSSVGVGDATASPTAALLLSIFQESSGRLATILFAHRFGTAFEPECKMYRLLADVLNDIAFVLDCLSPALPKSFRIAVLSAASILRALCGVAAGSAKASLSAHFAKLGNLAELNAKDSSQETVISLLGMLVGSVVVSWVTTPIATWTVLILLLAVHLETNRRAVRAVVMRTLNRQRATLVYYQLVRGLAPLPADVAREEIIFERSGVLRDSKHQVLGSCTIGGSFADLLQDFGSGAHSKTKSTQLGSEDLKYLLRLFQDEAYVLWYDVRAGKVNVTIVLKKSAKPVDMLKAWWHALELARDQGTAGRSSVDKIGASRDLIGEKLEAVSAALRVAQLLLSAYKDELEAKGWNLASSALESRSSARIVVK